MDLGLDPLDVRKHNLYGPDRYGMQVTDNILPEPIDTLERTSGYREPRTSIADFNRGRRLLKRRLALTPIKFGISFTTTLLNQAGALVHVYQDSSVHLNHGDTEMGEGLFVKVAQDDAGRRQVIRIVGVEHGAIVDGVVGLRSQRHDGAGRGAEPAQRRPALARWSGSSCRPRRECNVCGRQCGNDSGRLRDDLARLHLTTALGSPSKIDARHDGTGRGGAAHRTYSVPADSRRSST